MPANGTSLPETTGAIAGTSAYGNRVLGNYIGVDSSGNVAVSNDEGVVIADGAHDNFIGGGVGLGNVISGNSVNGIWISTGAHNNQVLGNLIGLNASSTQLISNYNNGIYISSASTNTIGGTNQGDRNVICGNGFAGVGLSAATGNFIQGNFIGSDGTGTNGLGSPGFGVYAEAGSSGNMIGGTTAEARNIITRNWHGIGIYSGSNNVIQGNFIGTDATGSKGLGNAQFGIYVTGPSSGGTLIGGAIPGAGNLISSNGNIGIQLNSAGCVIQGNLIGTDVTGTNAMYNSGSGIVIDEGGLFTQVGGTNAAARNIITGDGGIGVYSRSNKFQGNYFGLGSDGRTILGVPGIGLSLLADGNLIGGDIAGAGNVVAGHFGEAVRIFSSNNVVQGNFIGTDATGTVPRNNRLSGIAVIGRGNIIGGLTAGARNLISGNGNGIIVSGTAATENTIQGNLIGTDVTGTNALPNVHSGISLEDAPGNLVGGTVPAARNVISGNEGYNVTLGFAGASNNIVQGNYIGLAADGTTPLPAYAGVRFANSRGNVFGGIAFGAGNWIAHHLIHGIGMIGESTTDNAILGNHFFGNGALGIDLGEDALTPNDPGDGDTGQNRLQNFPEIVAAGLTGAALMIRYRVDSAVGNSSYPVTLEIFLADSPASGEGKTLIHRSTYNTPQAFTNVTFTPATTVNEGDAIVATATDANGNTSEFSPATQAQLGTLPEFMLLLTNRTVIASDMTTFSGLASGVTPISYQWFYNDTPLPGATGSAFSITNVQPVAAGHYYGIAQNAFGSATSAVATLTVLERPQITQPLVNQTVRVGEIATFQASFSGTPPYGLLWRRNLSPIFHQSNVFATTASFSVTNVTLAMQSNRYDLIITNATGGVGVVSAAFMMVEEPASITGQPTNAVVSLGGSATFCAGASGTAPLRYQWRHNGANIIGATNACLAITNVQLTHGGAYSVVVENAFGAVVSEPALLSIIAPLAPPGDLFSDRTSLSNFLSGLVSGTNDFATKESGEPDHGGKPGGRSVWYSWTASENGIATFRTAGSAFDTLLGIYLGTNVANLTTVAGDEDSGGSFTSEARFRVIAGNVYAIAIDGFGGASGRYLLSWDVEPTADELPVITAQPASQTVISNGPASFSVSASGSGLRFQWFFNDSALPGETNSVLSIANVKPDDVGMYRVTVTNNFDRGAESQVATLEIGPQPAARTQDKFEDLFAGGAGFGSGAAIASLAGGSLIVSAGLPISMFLNNTNATTQQGEPTECRIGGASRWINLRVDSQGVCVLDTQGSGIDTVLAVYTGASPFALTPVVFEGMTACNDNAATNVTWSRVRFLAQTGIEYRVQVDGANGQSGLIALNAAIGQPPSVSGQPTNSVVPAGDAIVLESGVTNAVDYGFQWLWNGREIAGATNATLIIPSVLAASGGEYSVTIRNRFGTTTRLVATIQVEVPYLTPLGLNPAQQRLQMLVQRPAHQALVVEGSADLGVWRPLHTIPLTAPGPVIELPWTNSLQFYRVRPFP